MDDLLSPNLLMMLAIFLVAAGVFALGLSLLIQGGRRDKALQRIDQLVYTRRQTQNLSAVREELSTTKLTGRLDALGASFGKTKAFNWFIEEEDRRLLGKAGFGTDEDLQRFVLIRLGLAGLGAALFLLSQGLPSLRGTGLLQFVAMMAVGFMGPKWLLRSVATFREQAFERELVGVVDILRLLQGVGLSVDQSIEVMATQLRDMVPITGKMLYKSRTQVQSGVPWNTILKRIGEVYTTAEFRSFVTVVGQIEKFGGAVQEPLRQFSERLIEKQRANAKESIGELTVKITGIMVATMLPALLIVAGGPGVIAMSNTF